MDIVEAIIPILGMLLIFGIPLLAIYTSHLRKMKELDLGAGGIDNEELRELRQQVGQLMVENELLKETMSEVQRSLGQPPTRIELSDYEKQQIKIDQENKNFY